MPLASTESRKDTRPLSARPASRVLFQQNDEMSGRRPRSALPLRGMAGSLVDRPQHAWGGTGGCSRSTTGHISRGLACVGAGLQHVLAGHRDGENVTGRAGDSTEQLCGTPFRSVGLGRTPTAGPPFNCVRLHADRVCSKQSGLQPPAADLQEMAGIRDSSCGARSYRGVMRKPNAKRGGQHRASDAWNGCTRVDAAAGGTGGGCQAAGADTMLFERFLAMVESPV
jgi:hypothetical protein